MWLLLAIVQRVCPDTKVKKFSLIALKQEVLKQPGVNSVVLLLKFTLMKSILMKRSKLRKEKIHNICSRGQLKGHQEVD